MAQLFKPYANVVARTSIVLGGAAPVLIGLAAAAYSRSPYNTKVEVPLNQPIPFSHQHHAYELGIDCRYCHTTVEKSSFAGLPPTETCMSCHSQIWTNSPLLEPVRRSYESGTPIEWNKVNSVPAFVNFNHSIHIARGVNCNDCHGAVNDMQITWKGRPFQMQWCLECHRAPEKYLYKDPESASPRQQVFNLYWKLQEKGPSGLTPREHALVSGHEQQSNHADDVKVGKQLVEAYGVKVQQLADCSVCHY
ncbi:MAG: hypothetical protein QOJ65_1537 [Fimbriimonadaceae bacterium]|jgi:hypothetical protein|nr:hypothetical protein [Fimbriimonadaceae bacterium]